MYQYHLPLFPVMSGRRRSSGPACNTYFYSCILRKSSDTLGVHILSSTSMVEYTA